MEVKATFIYETRSILVLSSSKEEINSMLQKFVNKLNPDSKIVDYKFFYEGNLLDTESTIENSPLIGGKNEINISVQKNLRILKCPKCNYNDCIISLANYSVSFYGCEHKHSFTTTYDKYFKNQKMELSEIRCCVPSCEHDMQNDNFDFFLCLTCSQLMDKSKSYCYQCNKTHDKEHVRIKFDNKNYYCKKHFNKFFKYCFKCKKNLCEDCVKEHSDHGIKSYESMTPNPEKLEKIKNSLKDMKKNISTLKLVIEDIIYSLNGTMRIFQNYYDIANNIITKYEMFNKDQKSFKNFTILKCLRNLQLSNEQIMGDLNAIINEKNIYDKTTAIINIYKNKKDSYKGNSNDNNLNNENDEDWLKEINQKEDRPTSNQNVIKEDGKKKKVKKHNINNNH